MSTKDGGSAFPEIQTVCRGENGDYHYETESYGGMTLRDYMAAKALQGMLARNVERNTKELVAKDAYGYADAMLRAREAA